LFEINFCGVVNTVSVLGRLLVVTGTIVAILPLGIVLVIADSFVAIVMCMMFFFVSLVSIASLNP